MKLKAAVLGLTLGASTLLAQSSSPPYRMVFEIRSGHCSITSTGGIEVEVSAPAVIRLESGTLRLRAPATLRLKPTRPFTLTLNGSRDLEIEMQTPKPGFKSVKVAGPVIEFEGDSSRVSLANSRMVKVE